MLDHDKTSVYDLTSFVTFRMARTQNKLNAQAAHLLKAASGLSLVEWRIIQLLRHMGPVSMTTLSAEVQMDKGQLSRKITAMIEGGLVRSNTDSADHRRQILTLTTKANALSEEMLPIMRKRQGLLIEGITKEKLDVFFEVLGVIDRAAENRDFS